jgi:hypothetical protein
VRYISADGYSSELVAFPRKSTPSSHYHPRTANGATPHLLTMPNEPARGKLMLYHLQNSYSSDALLVSEKDIQHIYGGTRSTTRHRCVFTAYDLGLFVNGLTHVMIGKRQPGDKWLLYPVTFRLASKFTCLHTGEKLHIGQAFDDIDSYGACELKKRGEERGIPLSHLDVDKHAFAEHLAEEMRDLSYLIEGVDMASGHSAAFSYWEWDALATPEFEAELGFLASYLNRLCPQYTTTIRVDSPRALQNGKSIWPSITVTFGGRMDRAGTGWGEIASKWATKLFHENQLKIGAQEMTAFRALTAEDNFTRPQPRKFAASNALSNHQALNAQMRFGPLPTMP